MTIYKITFRLNDDNPYENNVLQILGQYPHETVHQTAKELVSVFCKLGLSHPGVNPHVAQEYYQPPDNSFQVVDSVPMGYAQPPPIQPIQPSDIDEFTIEPTVVQAPMPQETFTEEPINQSIPGGIEPISFDFS